MRHLINQQERFLFFHVDHEIVAENLRQFGEEEKWAERGFDKNDPKIPAALRVLKPSAVFVHPDFVSLDFGGAFFEMEIRAFKPGVTGQGTKKLAEGLWFYSEDGGYPRED
jgi:hypothetical protein